MLHVLLKMLNKKGISPLIATVLIIGLVIIATVVVYNFVSEITKKQLEEGDKTAEASKILLNYDTTCKNHHGRSEVSIQSNSNYDTNFAIMFDDKVLTNQELNAFYKKTFVSEEISNNVKAVPKAIVDGELIDLNLQSQEESCSADSNSYALSFESGDYVELSSIHTIGQGNSGAMSFWAKINKGSYNGPISMFTGTGNDMKVLPLGCIFLLSGRPLHHDLSEEDARQWNHFILNLDGSTLRLFVNGDTTEELSSFAGQIDILEIGKVISSATSTYDEIMIWDRPLTEEEILNMYNHKVYPQNGLVSYWNFDKNVDDQTENNHGTLHGNSGYIGDV
jgi:FlaG/FlaF family flagellin (archaellin)